MRKISEVTKKRKREESQRLNRKRRKTKTKSEREDNIILLGKLLFWFLNFTKSLFFVRSLGTKNEFFKI